MITSTKNPKIKRIRSLQTQNRARCREQAFIIEGVRLVEEAYNADWDIELILYTEQLGERGQRLLENFTDREQSMEMVAPHVMLAASDTGAPQGILAVARMRELPVPRELDFILIVDSVRDPGNLGTILRASLAAGVQAVLIPPTSVDLYAPKVVRSAMGAHFRLPIHPIPWEQIAELIRQNELNVYLAEACKGDVYTKVNLRSPLAIIIGGEVKGAGMQARHLNPTSIHIPMPGKSESLNAAIATGVLLFEVARQRAE